jgi:hypothetical protein
LSRADNTTAGDGKGRCFLDAEALWLGGAFADLMPDEPEVHGLYALMLLDDARRDARFDGHELVLLADQDRSRWNAAQIAHGRAALDIDSRQICGRLPLGRPEMWARSRSSSFETAIGQLPAEPTGSAQRADGRRGGWAEALPARSSVMVFGRRRRGR